MEVIHGTEVICLHMTRWMLLLLPLPQVLESEDLVGPAVSCLCSCVRNARGAACAAVRESALHGLAAIMDAVAYHLLHPTRQVVSGGGCDGLMPHALFTAEFCILQVSGSLEAWEGPRKYDYPASGWERRQYHAVNARVA